MGEKLYDIVTNEELTIFCMKADGQIDAVGTADRTGNLIYNLAHYNKVDEAEMRRLLQHSSIDGPIEYKDELYWAEVE